MLGRVDHYAKPQRMHHVGQLTKAGTHIEPEFGRPIMIEQIAARAGSNARPRLERGPTCPRDIAGVRKRWNRWAARDNDGNGPTRGTPDRPSAAARVGHGLVPADAREPISVLERTIEAFVASYRPSAPPRGRFRRTGDGRLSISDPVSRDDREVPMRTPSLIAVSLLVFVAPASTTFTATASPATCLGQTATIVAGLEQQVMGTDGPDVIVSAGGDVDAGGGDDLVCITQSEGHVHAGAGDDLVTSEAVGASHWTYVELGDGRGPLPGGWRRRHRVRRFAGR